MKDGRHVLEILGLASSTMAKIVLWMGTYGSTWATRRAAWEIDRCSWGTALHSLSHSPTLLTYTIRNITAVGCCIWHTVPTSIGDDHWGCVGQCLLERTLTSSTFRLKNPR